MIPAIGDTLDGRYTLIAQYRTQPGLSAWIAHDYALDEDCQIFLLTDSTRIGVVSQIASALVLSHNPRSTAVRRFHTVGGALLVVMEPDHGIALSTLTDTKDPQNHLSFAAMRMVTNELIDTIQSLHASQVDFHTLTPEVVRLTDRSLVLSAVPLDPYIEPPLVTRARQTSTAPEMLAILQIAAILFQMMTGVTFDPRDMETMDRKLLEARHSAQLRGTDLPVDFLTILERALGVRMTGDRSDDRLFPIYTLMEMQALLDDPRRPGDLGPDDLTVPQSAGTSSVALAHLLPSDQQDLVDIPDSLVSTDTVHNEAGVIAPWSRQELFTGTDVQEIDPAAGGLFGPDTDASDKDTDGNNDLGHDNASGTSRADLADMLNGEVGSEDGLTSAGPSTSSGAGADGDTPGGPDNGGSPASAPSASAPAGNAASAGSVAASARSGTSVPASQTGAAGTGDIDATTVFAPLDARHREEHGPDQARPQGVNGAAGGSSTTSAATGVDSPQTHPVRRTGASGAASPDDRAAAASASFSEALQEQRAERSAHTQTIVDHHELSDADSARFDEKERKERTKKENPHRLAQGIVIAVAAAAVIAVGAVAIHELHGTGAIALPWSQQEKDSNIGKKWDIDVSKAPLPGSAKQEQQEQQEDADDQSQGSGSSASNGSASSSKSSKKPAGSTKQKTGSTTGRKQAKSAGTGSASLLKGTKNASAVPKPVEPVTNPVRLAFTQRFFSTSDGRGIAISLTGRHRVSQVSLTLQSQTSAGTGKIYIDSTASDPRHGSPVATFTFAGGNQPTTITLPGNPSTQNLVVWVDQAPTNGFYYSNLSVLGQ